MGWEVVTCLTFEDTIFYGCCVWGLIATALSASIQLSHQPSNPNSGQPTSTSSSCKVCKSPSAQGDDSNISDTPNSNSGYVSGCRATYYHPTGTTGSLSQIIRAGEDRSDLRDSKCLDCALDIDGDHLDSNLEEAPRQAGDGEHKCTFVCHTRQPNHTEHQTTDSNSPLDMYALKISEPDLTRNANNSSPSILTGANKRIDQGAQDHLNSAANASRPWHQGLESLRLQAYNSNLCPAHKLLNPEFWPHADCPNGRVFNECLLDAFSNLLREPWANPSTRHCPMAWLHIACALARRDPGSVAFPAVLGKMLQLALEVEIQSDRSRKTCTWLLPMLVIWTKGLQKAGAPGSRTVLSKEEQSKLKEQIAGLQNVTKALSDRLQDINSAAHWYHPFAKQAPCNVCEFLEATLQAQRVPLTHEMPCEAQSCQKDGPLAAIGPGTKAGIHGALRHTTPRFAAEKSNVSQDHVRQRRLVNKWRPRSASKPFASADWGSSNSSEHNLLLLSVQTAQDCIAYVNKCADAWNAPYPLHALEDAFTANGVQPELQQAGYRACKLFLQSALHPIPKVRAKEDTEKPVLVLGFSYTDSD